MVKIEDTNLQAIEVTPYLKITRNSKGVNWEFKINKVDIEEAAKIDEELCRKFGREIDND